MAKFPFLIQHKDGDIQLVLGDWGTTSWQVSRRLATHNLACDTPTVGAEGYTKIKLSDPRALDLLIKELSDESKSEVEVREAELYRAMQPLVSAVARIQCPEAVTSPMDEDGGYTVTPCGECWTCNARKVMGRVEALQDGQ